MAEQRKDGGPAFPMQTFSSHSDGQYSEHSSAGGMSLRDYFAAAAVTGMQGNVGANRWTAAEFAQQAYKIADAMLKARDQ